MNIAELSVRRPVLMTVIYALICVICVIFIPQLDTALYPSVEFPMLSVSVSCGDAGPEEIELQIAKKLENQLDSLEGLKTITSQCQSGRCNVMLEFEYGTDLDEAYSDVQTLVNRITRSLPDWAETPTIMKFDMSMMNSSVMSLMLSGNKSKEELSILADEIVEPMLMRIDGVAQVDISGKSQSEYEVTVVPSRLAAYGITLSQIVSVIKARNTQSTSGEVKKEGMKYSVVIDERYTDINEIAETVITTIDGYPVKVSDVAEVRLVENTGGSTSYLNGNPIVQLSISSESDASDTQVAKKIREAIPSINAELPEGIELIIRNDSTQMITSTLTEVYKSAILGVVLAAIVIFVFLRNIKSTIIISLSMPICIMITLMVMAFADVSVNSLSMSGLILAIGMIVDASIIILENTYYFRSIGKSSAAAAILGSRDMFNAILASTLTTLCVFIPMLIFKKDLGMIGMMSQDMVVTVCISLACSLFVAVTLVPALSGSILRINSRTQRPLKFPPLRAIDNFIEKAEQGMKEGYGRVLSYCLNHKLMIVVILLLLLGFSLTFFTGMGMNLTPQMMTDDQVSFSLTMPNGTVKEVTQAEVFKVYNDIKTNLPKEAYTSITVNVSNGNTGSISISLPDITEQKYSATEIKQLCLPYLNTKVNATWSSGSGRGPGGGTAINVEILSEDSQTALEAADEIASILKSYVPEVTNIQNDITNGAPKIAIALDTAKARDLGVSASALSAALSAAISGTTATELTTFSASTTYDVVVKFQDKFVEDIDSLSNQRIPATNGSVLLGNIAEFSLETSPARITRENKRRVNHVTASLATGFDASEAQAAVDQALADHLVLPEGVTINQKGEMADFGEFKGTLIKIVIVSLILVYGVMAAQFESLIDPFIIFATIPLLMIGVIFIHILMDMSFTMFSVVGVVALIGVVVNNGIVLVDCINRLIITERLPVYDACLAAGKGRLRPILMTTITTVLGLVPMAFFPGEGSEMLQPIALTFFGGLISGAFLTLILSPVLYAIFNKHKEKHYNDPEALVNQLRQFDIDQLNEKIENIKKG